LTGANYAGVINIMPITRRSISLTLRRGNVILIDRIGIKVVNGTITPYRNRYSSVQIVKVVGMENPRQAIRTVFPMPRENRTGRHINKNTCRNTERVLITVRRPIHQWNIAITNHTTISTNNLHLVASGTHRNGIIARTANLRELRKVRQKGRVKPTRNYKVNRKP
jgi:hypothetical protein